MSQTGRIYLDANSTTCPLDRVVEETARVMRSGAANPASAHAAGAEARRIVERVRDNVCDLVAGAVPEDVVFVSGGTEANNMVISAFTRDPQSAFLAAPVEHASILKPLSRAASDGRLRWLRVDSCGRIDPEEVARQARQTAGKIVLALQMANSETGVLQPVGEIVRVLRANSAGAFVLLDAAQAIGRTPLDIDLLDVDAVSFSGHKLHGPMGIGVLVLRGAEAGVVSPLLLGGGQERGMRAGTLNVPGIAGLGVALAARTVGFAKAVETLAAMRDAFETQLLDRLGNSVSFNGAAAERVPNTSNARFEGVDGMRMLALLDERGVMASQGSACSSARPEPSATLLAMGLSPRDAFASLRFSFSVLNTIDEAGYAADAAASIAKEIAS